MSMSNSSSRDSWRVLLSAALTGIIILSAIGYGGFRLYVGLDKPETMGIGLIALASLGGVAAFFSPCSFPLLVSLFARETGTGGGNRSPILFASAFSAGATAFLLIVSLFVGFVGVGAFSDVSFVSPIGRTIRLVAGVSLIMFGLAQLNLIRVSLLAIEGLATPLLKAQARLRRRRPGIGYGLFGFSYLVAGFG